VTRNDAATYTCQAKNDAGVSDVVTLPLDVKCKLNLITIPLLSIFPARLVIEAHAQFPDGSRWFHH